MNAILTSVNGVLTACMIMFLYLFICAHIAISFFEPVAARMPFAEYQQYANFRNVYNAIQLLFVLSTGDGWEDSMHQYVHYIEDMPTWVVEVPFMIFSIIAQVSCRPKIKI